MANNRVNGDDHPDEQTDSDELGLRRIDPLAGDHSEYEDARLVARILGEPPPPPPRLADRWVLLERLGSGGMGEVLAAYDLQFDCKVAIKFLRVHDGQDAEAARTRFRREGSAMRQIPRPANVVQVHDVSPEGEPAYLVMEYIEGPTLEKWQRDRALDEIVAAYRQAGAGLAAIHAAGLVHRDFKPANALVAEDAAGNMHVSVSDLGLAYATEPAAARPDGVDGDSALHPAKPLTVAGTKLGTIQYMAPEQLRGEQADARSDQFAFCVSLYEALCGERPFHVAKAVPEALLELMRRGMPAARQRNGKPLPARIEHVLRRGLAMDPAERFPDMKALLAELESRPRRAWPWLLAGSVVVAAAFAVLLFTREQPDPCRLVADHKLERFWNPGIEERLRARTSATQDTALERAWEALERALRTKSSAWHAQFMDLCSKAPDAELAAASAGDLAPGRACLRHGRETLTRVSDATLSNEDVHDPRAAGRLYDDALRVFMLRDCSQRATWMAFPESVTAVPGEDAPSAELESLGQKLIRIEQLARAARYDDARELAQEATADMRKLGENPMLAEPMYRLGEVLTYLDAHAEAAPLLQEAADLAATHHMHALASDIWLYRLKHVLVDLDDPELGRSYMAVARHALQLAGDLEGDTIRRAEYEEALGLLASREDRFEEAARHHEEALRIREGLDEQIAGDPSLAILLRAKSLNNLANVRRELGQHGEAVERYLKALEWRKDVQGPEHPDVGQVVYNLGLIAILEGEHAQALDHLSRALAIEEKRAPARVETLLSRHRAIGTAAVFAHAVEQAAGNHESASQHLERAIRHADAIAPLHRRLAEENPAAMQEQERIDEHVFLANVHSLRDDTRGGLAQLEAALRIREREKHPCTCGAPQTDYRDDLISAGSLLCELNRAAEARAYLEKALKPPVSCPVRDPSEIPTRIQEEISSPACLP